MFVLSQNNANAVEIPTKLMLMVYRLFDPQRQNLNSEDYIINAQQDNAIKRGMTYLYNYGADTNLATWKAGG